LYLILVDNNFISSRGIKALLDKNEINCEVVNCSSREALLDISRKLSADIIIIDFDIFAGDAAETIVILRRHSPKAYILGLINNEQYEKLQHAIKLGIDDYMVKPLQINELILRVKIGIRRKEKRIEKHAADVRKEQYLAKQGDSGQHLDEEIPVRQVLNYSEDQGSETKIEHEEQEAEIASESALPDFSVACEVEEIKAEPSLRTHIPKSFPKLLDDRNECKEEKGEKILRQEIEKEKPEKAIGYGNCNGTGVLRKTAVNKLAKIANNLLTLSLLLFLFFLSVFLIQGRISGGATEIAGHRMYVVLSGSMSPAFDAGSLVFVRSTEPAGIKEGDIISFSSPNDHARLTIHRVVQVKQENGFSFTTRGDANIVNDSNPVTPEQLVGKMTVSIPYLGYIFGYAQTRQGSILFIFIPVALILIFGVRCLFAFQAKTKLAQILISETPKKGLIKPCRKHFHVDDADPGEVKAPGRMCHLLLTAYQ